VLVLVLVLAVVQVRHLPTLQHHHIVHLLTSLVEETAAVDVVVKAALQCEAKLNAMVGRGIPRCISSDQHTEFHSSNVNHSS
jgi:hypothetical protein